MPNALRLAVCGVAVGTCLASPVALASNPGGGGTQRWTATYDSGAPSFATAVAVSPDGSTVFVTGTSGEGRTRKFATLAYAADTGATRWTATYLGSQNPGQFGAGRALAVSADGSTLFVTGDSACSRCDGEFYEGFSTVAYSARTGDQLWVARYADGLSAASIEVTRDGSALLVNGSTDGGEASVTLAYDPDDGDRLWTNRSTDRPVYRDAALATSRDSSTVFVAGTHEGSGGRCPAPSGFRATAFDTATGQVRWSSHYQVDDEDNCGSATSLRMTPDGTKVIVTGYGGPDNNTFTFRAGTVAFDAATGARLWDTQDERLRVGAGDSVIHLAASADSSKVFIVGYDCAGGCDRGSYEQDLVTAAYDSTDGERLWASRYRSGGIGWPHAIAVDPDGSSVYVTGEEQVPCVSACNGLLQPNAPLLAYDADSGAQQWATSYPHNLALDLASSPDGSSLYLAGTFTAAASARSAAHGATADLFALDKAACSPTACGYATVGVNTGPGPGRFQDDTPFVRYDGWKTFFDKRAVGAAYRGSETKGGTASFVTPKTTSITWQTRRGPNQGRARVIIDGRKLGVVDLYDEATAAATFTFDELQRRRHHVEVRVLGQHNPSSTGRWVAIDGFKLGGPTRLVSETSSRLRYSSWSTTTRDRASGNTYRQSSSPRGNLAFTFRGRAITWLTKTGPDFGKAELMIDGRETTVDLYRPKTTWRAKFRFDGLPKGRHEVVIRPLGKKNVESSSHTIVHDAFIVGR